MWRIVEPGTTGMRRLTIHKISSKSVKVLAQMSHYARVNLPGIVCQLPRPFQHVMLCQFDNRL